MELHFIEYSILTGRQRCRCAAVSGWPRRSVTRRAAAELPRLAANQPVAVMLRSGLSRRMQSCFVWFEPQDCEHQGCEQRAVISCMLLRVITQSDGRNDGVESFCAWLPCIQHLTGSPEYLSASAPLRSSLMRLIAAPAMDLTGWPYPQIRSS